MKKLIDLLNEYEKSGLNEFEEYEEWWYCKWNGKILTGNYENNNELTPYELCSKKFGFIKWLVDNDKIRKNYKDGLPAITKNGFLLEGESALLMLLATQDKPIEFLIQLLK